MYECGCASCTGDTDSNIVHVEASSPVAAVQGTTAWGGGGAQTLTVYAGGLGIVTGNGTGEANWTAAELAALQTAFADISKFVNITFNFTNSYADSNLSVVLNNDNSSLGSASLV